MTKLSLITGAALGGILVANCAALAQSPQDNGNGFVISRFLPYDVDTRKLGALDLKKQLPEAQRLFDVFAWQCFIALNWPALPDGAADPNRSITDLDAPRVWEGWRTNDSIYLPDGAKPAPWSEGQADANRQHVMWRFSKMLNETQQPVNELSASTQAFTGPLVDQYGKFARYESYINRTQFDYIVENTLYNQQGQVTLAQTGGRVVFPANVTGTAPRYGSMGVKLAWKQLGPDDVPSRFFTRQATVVSTSYDADGKPVKSRSSQLMGLVGMHITAKTQSSPTWIWATFEHVDNVTADDLQFGTTQNGRTVRLRPSFSNPDAPTKPINVMPAPNAEPDATGRFTAWDERRTTNPVQLTRAVPIPPATAALNGMVQRLLAAQGSVFRNYELIGTQWPAQPNFPAFGGGAGSAPESIVFKAPGRVVPVYLINSTMESYFQRGNQPAGPLEEDDRLPAGTFADGTREPVTPDRTVVFGTESCTGCHFSGGAAIGFKRDENGRLLADAKGAPIPIYGKNASFGQTGSSDFVWQLQLKARSLPPR